MPQFDVQSLIRRLIEDAASEAEQPTNTAMVQEPPEDAAPVEIKDEEEDDEAEQEPQSEPEFELPEEPAVSAAIDSEGEFEPPESPAAESDDLTSPPQEESEPQEGPVLELPDELPETTDEQDFELTEEEPESQPETEPEPPEEAADRTVEPEFEFESETPEEPQETEFELTAEAPDETAGDVVDLPLPLEADPADDPQFTPTEDIDPGSADADFTAGETPDLPEELNTEPYDFSGSDEPEITEAEPLQLEDTSDKHPLGEPEFFDPGEEFMAQIQEDFERSMAADAPEGESIEDEMSWQAQLADRMNA